MRFAACLDGTDLDRKAHLNLSMSFFLNSVCMLKHAPTSISVKISKMFVLTASNKRMEHVHTAVGLFQALFSHNSGFVLA